MLSKRTRLTLYECFTNRNSIVIVRALNAATNT